METPRRFWKILLAFIGLNVAFSVCAWWVVVYRQEPLVFEQQERRLLDVCRIARIVVRDSLLVNDSQQLAQQVALLARETGLRLTVIAADGRVLADSGESAELMENHLERDELRAAAGPARFGIARRSSATTGKTMYYCAAPIVEGERPVGYVRVAAEARWVEQPLQASRRWLVLASSAVLLATGGWSYLVVERISRPVNELARRVAELSGDGTDESPADIRPASAPGPPLAPGDEFEQLDASVGRLEQGVARRMAGLRANADRLTNVLANMAEGVLALDAQQRIVLANEASRRLLEFVTGDIEGRPLWEVMRNRVIEQAVAETMHSKRPSTKEFESSVGSRRILTLRASCLPGEPSPGVVVVLHDVTDLRRLENLRREFVANVSHELKTPLASIKAYAETLRMGAVNDPEHNLEFVGRIEEQADRLHELIIDLLQLARIESGQEMFEITSVLVSPVVERCLAAYETSAATKRIELVTEAPAKPVWVNADEEGLRTILSNLIDNAIKYTPDGGRVTVRWNTDAREGWVEVQDTGIGIGKQHHARIFERFYRVDRARSRELGGTGLGLSIVKHMTQAFGGSVRLESQLRTGTTFRITLPLSDPTELSG